MADPEFTPEIVSGFDIAPLRRDLLRDGRAHLFDKEGQGMFFVLYPSFEGLFPKERQDIEAVLVAYEGEGAIFWDPSIEPMTKFLLIQKGFGIKVAPTLAAILKALFCDEAKPQMLEIAPAAMLEGPARDSTNQTTNTSTNGRRPPSTDARKSPKKGDRP